MSDLVVKKPQAPQEFTVGSKERALLMGDLSKLTEVERGELYFSLCKSCGLNPLTQPLSYILLNGRWTFYFNKGGADQLRSVHKISIAILSREKIGDCYAVTAQATTPDGRSDTSTGVVSIGAGAKGDFLANLLMKAETKAKRRVTLSICGLGYLDESELDTVEEYKTAEPPKINLKPEGDELAVPAHLGGGRWPASGEEALEVVKNRREKLAAETLKDIVVDATPSEPIPAQDASATNDLSPEEMDLAKDIAKSKTKKGTIGVTALVDAMDQVKKAKKRAEQKAADPDESNENLPGGDFEITWGVHCTKKIKDVPKDWVVWAVDKWYPNIPRPGGYIQEFYKAATAYLNAKNGLSEAPPMPSAEDAPDELPF